MSARNAVFDGKIQSWGNSLGLRITLPISKLTHLTRGSEVEIEVTPEGLLIRPKLKESAVRFSESELIAGLTPEKAHADELPASLPSEHGF